MRCVQIIFLLLLPTALLAQEQYYNILNEDNGLLTNEVYNIHFSKEGFLFISGDKGIQKYDGAKLERILPSWNKSITWAKNDNYGGVIFQSFTGKYWRYAHDSTKLFFDNSAELTELGTYYIIQGRYLAIAGNRNLYWYDILNKTIDTVIVHNYKKTSGEYSDLTIIACNEKGVFARVGIDKIFRINLSGEKEFISLEETKGVLLIQNIVYLNGIEYFVYKKGTGSQHQFFEVYKIVDGVLKKEYSLSPIPDESGMNAIRQIDDKLYVTSSQGFWELDKQFKKKHLKAKLPKMAISQLVHDGMGGLYISTVNNGVYHKPKLNVERLGGVFSDHDIKQFDDTQEELYFINDKGALYNAQNQRLVEEVKAFSLNKFSKHKANKRSLIVFGSTVIRPTISYALNNSRWHVNRIDGFAKLSGWFADGEIYAGGSKNFSFSFYDSVKRNQFYERYQSIFKYNHQEGRLKIYNSISRRMASGFFLKFRNKRAYDYSVLQPDESFYVAYEDFLYHYYPGKKVHSIKGNTGFEKKHKSSNLEIRHLHQLSNGHIWAGGFKGLMRIEKDSALQYYDIDNGLPANRIEFMKGFGDTILLGFAKSVCLFSEAKGIFQTYSSATLFDNGTIKDAHIFKGQLFVSTTKGSYKLAIQSREINNPKAFIRYINAEGERWDTQNAIPFSQNNISIQVNGLNINSGGAFSYYYRLSENDKWTKQDNANNIIRFNALVEGNYTFQFKVVNQWGEESEVVTQSFTISPPFVRSWLFYILCGLLALGIIAFIFYRRVKAIRQKEAVNRRIAESEISAIKAQMNPHFIFNALNSVQNLMLDDKLEQSLSYLGKFSDLVRRTLATSDENNLPLADELEMINLYLDLEKLRFKNEIVITLDVNLENEIDQIIVPALLIQPYIENVFKHGLLHKDGAKNVWINFKQDNNLLLVEIKDNGVGRANAKQMQENRTYKSFSSKANEKRLELLNEMYQEQIKVEITDAFPNQDDCGTLVKLQLPIIKKYS